MMQNFEFVCWDWSCSRGISWTLVVCVGKPWIHWTFNSIPIPAISKLWQGRRRNCKTRIEASVKWKTWLLSHGKLQLGHFWRHDLTNERQWQIQIQIQRQRQRQSAKLGFSHMETVQKLQLSIFWTHDQQKYKHKDKEKDFSTKSKIWCPIWLFEPFQISEQAVMRSYRYWMAMYWPRRVWIQLSLFVLSN